MTEHIVAESPKSIERRAYIAGLRQLAEFIETHPALPVPLPTDQTVYVDTKAALVEVARQAGVRWQKRPVTPDSKYFELRVEFAGGHAYAVFTDRAHVCRKVVTGTRIEPAKPEQIVDEYQWVCDEPLLATGGGQ